LDTVDKAPPPSKRAAISSKGKAVADNAESDSESTTLPVDDFSEREDEVVELSPKENQDVI